MPSSTVRPPEHEPDPPEPTGRPAAAGGDVQTEARETGQGPQPRDGPDPVVVHRGGGVVRHSASLRDRHHELGVEAAAEHGDDGRADQAARRHDRNEAVRHRGPQPAVQAGGEHDHQHGADHGDAVEGEHQRAPCPRERQRPPGWCPRTPGGRPRRCPRRARSWRRRRRRRRCRRTPSRVARCCRQPAPAVSSRSERTGLVVVTVVVIEVFLSVVSSSMTRGCRAGCPDRQGHCGTFRPVSASVATTPRSPSARPRHRPYGRPDRRRQHLRHPGGRDPPGARPLRHPDGETRLRRLDDAAPGAAGRTRSRATPSSRSSSSPTRWARTPRTPR